MALPLTWEALNKSSHRLRYTAYCCHTQLFNSGASAKLVVFNSVSWSLSTAKLVNLQFFAP